MKTEVTELLGIEYPIIQGGMAWVAEYHLAAGVSNAGGLGLIGAASAPAEWVREQIRSARKLTDRPFGVNIMLMSPYADEVAKVIVEEGVKVVTTGAGSPEKYMQMWKEAGVKVIPVVASTALARRMERCGADAVVAEGCEAGGHIGENTTMVLVPQIVDALKIPVIAAGVYRRWPQHSRPLCWGLKRFSWEQSLLQQRNHRSMRIIKKPLSRQKISIPV